MAPTTKKKKLISCLLAGGEPSSSRNLELKKKSLNVSAGRVFYERASSRRERHRAALQAADLETVALGRHCKRGSSTSGSTCAVLRKTEHDGSGKMRIAVAIAKQRAALKRSPSEAAAVDKTSIVAKRRRTVASASHDAKQQNSKQVMNAAPTTRLVVPQTKDARSSSRFMLGKAVKTSSKSTASRSSSCQQQPSSSPSCISHRNKKRALDNLNSRSTTARKRHGRNTAFVKQKKKVQKGIMPPSPQHTAAAGERRNGDA